MALAHAIADIWYMLRENQEVLTRLEHSVSVNWEQTDSKLNDLGNRLINIKGDTTRLVSELEAIKGSVDAEVAAKLDSVLGLAQQIDEQVPDPAAVPSEPPAEPTA